MRPALDIGAPYLAHPKGITPVPIFRTPRPLAILLGGALVVGGALVATQPAFAVATTLHVTASGDDSTGTGTSAAPFASLQHAIDIAVDGDTISLGDGAFAGAGTARVWFAIFISYSCPRPEWTDWRDRSPSSNLNIKHY